MARVLPALLVVFLLAGAIAVAGSATSSLALNVLGWQLPLFAVCVLLAFAIQWLAFVPAWVLKTEHFYDLVGCISYLSVIFLAIRTLPEPGSRAWLIAGLIVIWALRLGLFLFMRVRRSGGDSRFDVLKTRFWRFFLTWNLQGLWVTFTAAAAIAAICSSKNPGIDIWALIGLSVWLVGFGLEVVADEQKRRFRSDPGNTGQFIQTGLWSISRHPNYLGEIILWLGIAIIAVPSLHGWAYATLISPLFVIALLTRISGINLLEAAASKRWGDDPAYQSYTAKTPVLWPRFGSGS